jgi:hypothetical protein
MVTLTSYKMLSTSNAHAPYVLRGFLVAETKGRSQPLPPAYPFPFCALWPTMPICTLTVESSGTASLPVAKVQRPSANYCARQCASRKKDSMVLNECRRTCYSLTRPWPCRVACIPRNAATLSPRRVSSETGAFAQAVSNPSVA